MGDSSLVSIEELSLSSITKTCFVEDVFVTDLPFEMQVAHAHFPVKKKNINFSKTVRLLVIQISDSFILSKCPNKWSVEEKDFVTK